ncbi:MAG: hypothetical protein ACRBBP_05875 [Bdellovibrionales bacterium]
MDNFGMQNLDASKIPPLAFDFQSTLKSFSSTKVALRQRYIDKILGERNESNKQPAKPSTTDQLFTEIKGLLADF